MNKYFAEVFATFALVFAGCGAMVIDDQFGGITHVGVALTFGLIVTAMIYAVGDVSGAHLNPAVTLGFVVSRRMEWKHVAPYIISQCIGAIAAAVCLRLMFPQHLTLGLTAPAGVWWQSFAMELLLTANLMFVILGVTTGSKEKGVLAGLAVGATIALSAMFAGPVCGASMNPARSLGPALVSGHLSDLWIYLIATPLGAVLGVGGYWLVYSDAAKRGEDVADEAE